MNTKLTLSINENVITRAKAEARKKRVSLSKMVEEYLTKISQQNQGSIVEDIIRNAPVHKIKRGTEKKILLDALKKKYGA